MCRMLWPMYSFNFRSNAVRRIRSQPRTVIAIGFSRYTALPAFSAATACSSWRKSGEVTKTAPMSFRARSRR